MRIVIAVGLLVSGCGIIQPDWAPMCQVGVGPYQGCNNSDKNWEPIKVAEPPKAEPPKADPSKVETPATPAPEPIKPDPPKADPPKPEPEKPGKPDRPGHGHGDRDRDRDRDHRGGRDHQGSHDGPQHNKGRDG